MATTVSTTGSVTNITVQTGTQNLFSNVAADTGTVVVDNTVDTLTIAGGTGITTTGTPGTDTITIAGSDASTSNKGIASFSSSNFDVSSGAVSLKANGVNDTHLDFGTGTNQINTDDLTEGSTNLYFTNARADARIGAASINDLSDVTTTGVSNGNVLAYNSSSGIFEPSSNTPLSLIDEDDFSTDSDSRPPSQQSVKAYIATQIATKDNSDEITEGSTNLYFTNARADARFDTKLAAADTDNLSEGSSNLYFTNARADARAQLKVDALVDSAPGALDTLNELAAALGDDANFSTTVTNSIATKLATADFNSTFDTRLGTKDTDNLSEGSSNQYFTTARARASISASGSLAYNSSTGALTYTQGNTDTVAEGSTNLYFTDARARAAISASGSLSYNSSTGALTYTQAAIDADSTTISNLEVDNFKAATIVLEAEGIGSNDNDTTLPTSAAVKDYVDTQVAGKDNTDEITEGSTNLYFTNARAEAVSINNVVEDTTPQLGGSLDVNGNKIVSTSGADIDIEPNGTGDVLLGNFKFDADQTVGASQDNFVLTYDNSSGKISLEAASGGGGGLSDVVSDTSPQLGADLDVNGFKIKSVGSGGDVEIEASDKMDLDSVDDMTLTSSAGDIEITSSAGNVEIRSRKSNGRVRIRANNDIVLDPQDDLDLRSRDDFIFRKFRTGIATLSITATVDGDGGPDGVGSVTITTGSLDTFWQTAIDEGVGVYYTDSTNTDKIFVSSRSGTTGLTLEESASDATGVSATLHYDAHVVNTVVAGDSGATKFELVNRAGYEGPQARTFAIQTGLEFAGSDEPYSVAAGRNDGTGGYASKYEFHMPNNESTMRIRHKNSQYGGSESTQDLIRFQNRSNTSSTIASASHPDQMRMYVPIRLVSNTTAELNSRGGSSGEIVFCSDGDSGSACLAVNDGSAWKRISFGATISSS